MEVCVLPVSGGSFPHQMGLMSQLCKAQYRAKVMLGSSGGNIAAYLTAAGNWDPEGIVRTTTNLRSELFCQSWWPSYLNILPSYLIGFFRGSMYAEGIGGNELFETLFTPGTIGNTEIWTGTHNRDCGKAEFFCNLRREESVFKDYAFSEQTYNCLPLKYLDRDIPSIAAITQASASIPVFVPEKRYAGQYYTDGGTAFASPLTPFIPTFADIDDPVHIIYVNCIDVNGHRARDSLGGMYQKGSAALNDISTSLNIQDRNAGVEFVTIRGGIDLNDGGCKTSRKPRFEEGPCDLKKLEKLLEKRKFSKKSMLELYPTGAETVDICNFRAEDVLKTMKKSESSYRYRLWYL